MATAFKVTVLYEDGRVVPPYDMIVPDGSLFVANTNYAGANAKIVLPKHLSNIEFFVANTIDALRDNYNGTATAKRKYYYALINQSGAADPTVYLLNNRAGDFLGNLVWTRVSAGLYRATLTAAFMPYGTFVCPIVKTDGTMAAINANSQYNYIEINTGADTMLSFTPIEIIVFYDITPP
jgi:hypothetical protein